MQAGREDDRYHLAVRGPRSPGPGEPGRRAGPSRWSTIEFKFGEAVDLCRSRIMSFYDFDHIEQAAADAEHGVVVKPVLGM